MHEQENSLLQPFIVELQISLLQKEVEERNLHVVQLLHETWSDQCSQVGEYVGRDLVLVGNDGHQVEDGNQFKRLAVEQVLRRLPVFL